MSANDPRSTISFAVAPGSPDLPDVSQAALIIGASVVTETIGVWGIFGSGAEVRADFAESPITEIAEAHFACDQARHSIACVGAGVATPGVLHIDTSGIVGDTEATPDGTVKPLGDWPDVRVDVIDGGTVGVEGITLDLSIDGGLNKKRVALGTALFVEFAGKGIKINLTADTLVAGSVITGWTEPPKWDSTTLGAAATAITQGSGSTNAKWSLICLAEPVVPADWDDMTGLLNTFEASTPRRYCHLIASMRRQYKPATATVTATFATGEAETVVRASGSFIDDGFKPGMRLTVADSENNDGTYVKIEAVAADTITLSDNITLTGEIATSDVILSAMETDADYARNLASEWYSYHDERISLTNMDLRAARPYDGFNPDQRSHGFLLSRCIAEPIHIVPGQRAKTPEGGGTVAPQLGGRLYEGSLLALLDCAQLAALATLPSRAVCLQTEANGRGPFFTEARTMFEIGGADSIVYLHMARIVNEAKIVVLDVQVNQILSGIPSAPGNPKKLSERGKAAIEKACRVALQKRLARAISNAFVDDPEGPLFAVSDSTDLSTGVILCTMFFRSLFYPNGFKTIIGIKAPGV